MKRTPWRWLTAALAVGIAATACGFSEPPQAKRLACALPVSARAPSPAASGARSGALPGRRSGRHSLSLQRWRRLMQVLSEPGGEFISDNYLSNETSYLQVAAALARRGAAGGAYLGVGPEQNFSYLALLRPARAYIIDLRHDNLLLHLLYKAAFDLAPSREAFLSLLTGREPGGRLDDDRSTLGAVLAATEASSATDEGFARVHARLIERIEHGYGVVLDGPDRHGLGRIHRTFFRQGLALRFELRSGSTRRYPSLRELLSARDPTGRYGGFLATPQSYRFVRRMQQDNRIVPLVGNFAGDRAMAALASHLKGEQLTVSAFYVSNVEQYLMQDGLWWKWRRNIAALPITEQSVFIRAYLDQGQRHPRQLPGHRTATTLQRMVDFERHARPYGSMLALCTDALLPAG